MYNNKKVFTFDVESTGLNPAIDEILEISIIDNEEKILFHSYIKPYFHTRWDEAMKFNKITPEMVARAPYAHEVAPQVRQILEEADILVTYNGSYDMKMLERWNIDFSRAMHHDVMKLFSSIFGTIDAKTGSYKWQKLRVCARYFGYEFEPHDSLEDVKATHYCWLRIMEQIDFSKTFYTWDDLCDRADGAAHLSPELMAKDTAREVLTVIIKKKTGADANETESPEETIDNFVKEEKTTTDYLFDKNGNLL